MRKHNIIVYGCSQPTARQMYQCLEGDHRITPMDAHNAFPGGQGMLHKATLTSGIYTPLEAVIVEMQPEHENEDINWILEDIQRLQRQKHNRIPVLIIGNITDPMYCLAKGDQYKADVTISNIKINTHTLEDLYFMNKVTIDDGQIDFWKRFLENTFPNMEVTDEYS